MISLNTPWRLFIAAGLRAIGGLVLLAFTPSFLKRIYCKNDIVQCTVASNIDKSYVHLLVCSTWFNLCACWLR